MVMTVSQLDVSDYTDTLLLWGMPLGRHYAFLASEEGCRDHLMKKSDLLAFRMSRA